MPFNEYVGRTITLSLSRAMKKYNVSPSDFLNLERVFDEDDEAMTKAIVEYSPRGYFDVYQFIQENN